MKFAAIKQVLIEIFVSVIFQGYLTLNVINPFSKGVSMQGSFQSHEQRKHNSMQET